MAKNTSQTCLHCRAPIPTSSSGSADTYCCNGCRAAHALITEAGLTRYYELSQGAGTPGDTSQVPMSWLEPLVTTARSITSDPRRIAVTVDVQGLHCAGCVWLLQALFRKKGGALHLDVNPGLGRLTATYDPERFDLAAYLADLAQLGYRAGPPLRDGQSASDGLGLRLGITFAIAMNAMAVSAAGYFGLEPNDPDGLFTIFGWVNLVLAILAFSIGAPVFIRGAYQALKRRSFHLDLPIAIGLILAFSGSVALFFSGQPERAYFDTLDLFIALMLLGRWAQRRFLERNRRLLLEDDGFESARVKVLEGEGEAAVPVSRPLSAIRAGTRLLISPGELVPVAARLATAQNAGQNTDQNTQQSAGADFSLAWITGESDPVAHRPGSAVVAGAHLLGKRATVIECLEPFASSSLHDLLRRPAQEASPDQSADEADAARARRNTSFWHHVTTAYVAVVLVAALAALLAWLVRDASRALDVTTAVLVVTCPCAIGLATPLAYELAINRLRRLGLHTRRQGLLDRAKNLRAVVFDKTGTLTLGELSLENPEVVSGLTAHDRDALSQMVYRSNHPKSRALAVVVSPQSLSGEVEEQVGVGLTMTDPASADRQFALIAAPDGRDLRFVERRLSPDSSKSEYLEIREIARFAFREVIRADARAQVEALQRLGVEVHLASGDAEDRATAIGRELGIGREHGPARIHARMKPEDKAALIARLEATLGPTLMLGDGVNDALAFDAATVAGTPAIDRPTLPARADFFLTTRGVGPIAELLIEARNVRRITTRNLVIAFGYNGLALTAALMGVLSPLVSAVAMPISSLIVLALTIGSQREPRACPAPMSQPTPNLEATA